MKSDFGGADEPFAARFVEVLLYVKECVDREYDVAENKLPYEGAEGGYGEVWTTREVVEPHLGMGMPELGSARISELVTVRNAGGCG